ncbi:MAG: hypothetical protein ACRD20_08385 [Terriglobales bacterium]
MNTNKFVIGFCLVLLLAISVPRAQADQWNQATKVTFNDPVEIPGKALPAGTYWFTLMNDDPDRNIVQVWDSNRMHLLATVITVPDYRLQPKGRTVIKFDERPTGSPEALQAWFYPGDLYGHEFVYPEARATELAKSVGQPVLSMPDEVASNITKPAKSAKEPSVMAMKEAPVKAIKPSGEKVEMAEVVQPAPPGQKASAGTLPKTASSMPLWGLLGMLSLATAAVLGGIVKRIC